MPLQLQRCSRSKSKLAKQLEQVYAALTSHDAAGVVDASVRYDDVVCQDDQLSFREGGS